MILLINQALTCSKGAKVLYHFCRLQTHVHIKLTYTGQRKKKNETGEKGKEIKAEGKCSSNFPKVLPFKANTPVLIHTYLNGYFTCIILNNYKVSNSGFNEKLITNDISEKSQEESISLSSLTCLSLLSTECPNLKTLDAPVMA